MVCVPGEYRQEVKLLWVQFKEKQAFDSIAGNTVVPYQSLKFLNYHKLLFIAIYN